jgi:hypothetical protein
MVQSAPRMLVAAVVEQVPLVLLQQTQLLVAMVALV